MQNVEAGIIKREGDGSKSPDGGRLKQCTVKSPTVHESCKTVLRRFYKIKPYFFSFHFAEPLSSFYTVTVKYR